LQPWARAQGLLLYDDLLEMEATAPQTGGPALALISPAYNSVYRITNAFDPAAQRLLLEAITAPGLRQVGLWVDGQLVAQLEAPPYQAWWALQPGRHQAWATAISADGEQVSSEIVFFTVEDGE
jgi:hypothetical protein